MQSLDQGAVTTTGAEDDGPQEDRDQELWRRALDQPLNFYITNNMFDETRLYVAAPGGHRAKRRRTIAHGCQITYKERACDVQDVDVVRAPALVLRCTAATTAGVVGKPTDQCGIEPHVLPCAPFYGLLTATDSHSVNKKVSKVISQRVDKQKQIRLHECGRPCGTSSSSATSPSSASSASSLGCRGHGAIGFTGGAPRAS